MVFRTHSNELQIERAQKGVREVEACVARLTALRNGLDFLFFTGDAVKDGGAVAKLILETVHKHFDLTSPDGQRFAQAAQILEIRPGSTNEQMKEQLETNIAASKDLLTEAIRKLEKRISDLKDEDVIAEMFATASNARAVSESPVSVSPVTEVKPEKKEDAPLFHWKLSFYGIGVDLQEAWRRIRKKFG
jgi:hypothetical protein